MVLARVGGLMIFSPFFGNGAVSPLIRIAFSLVFSLSLFPLVRNLTPPLPGDFTAFLLTVSGELLIGILLGFVGRLFLAALQLAGQVIGFQMGFAVINVIDPQTQVESPVMSILQNLVGILVFLCINAHHWFIQAILDSYQIVGPTARFSSAVTEQIIHSAGAMFVLGLKLAAPVVVVLLIVDVLLGVVGRAAPQIHILVVGLPAKSLMGFVFLAATVHTFIPFLGRHFNSLQRELYTYLEILGR
jgi:flagellar biosynthetic protein FliR